MQLRSLSGAALALVLLVSLLLPCFDLCPEETEEESCPPVCASCIACPRSPAPVPALVDRLRAPEAIGHATTGTIAEVMPLLADDILHVPLPLAS